MTLLKNSPMLAGLGSGLALSFRSAMVRDRDFVRVRLKGRVRIH